MKSDIDIELSIHIIKIKSTHCYIPLTLLRVRWSGTIYQKHLCKNYKVDIIDNSFDGILGVKFTNKISDYVFVVFSCYLPPESSPWGRDASSFFSHLLTQIYIQYDTDSIFICGNLNARISNILDFDKDLDTIPPRLTIDNVHNQHGSSFLEFLNDCKFCVLNGRFGNNQMTIHFNRQEVIPWLTIYVFLMMFTISAQTFK